MWLYRQKKKPRNSAVKHLVDQSQTTTAAPHQAANFEGIPTACGGGREGSYVTSAPQILHGLKKAI